LNQGMRTDLIRHELKLVLLGVHRPTSTAGPLTFALSYCISTAGQPVNPLSHEHQA
jgi:hypothetical protein